MNRQLTAIQDIKLRLLADKTGRSISGLARKAAKKN